MLCYYTNQLLRRNLITTTTTILKRGNHNKIVKIVELSPRDGLQNEKTVLSTAMKVELIERLIKVGLREIESGSFVSPKWVPQMASTKEVLSSPILQQLRQEYGHKLNLPVLVPNQKGLDSLLKLLTTLSPNASLNPIDHRITNEISVFISASESFSKANLNTSIENSIQNLIPVITQAQALGFRVRGYVSVVIGCPFEGTIAPEQVRKVVKALVKLGVYEISLGDTVGVGTPASWSRLIKVLKEEVPIEMLAAHCHDSFGTGVANVLALVEHGIRTVDSSISGLGGCPYSPGATGNVATEDVVYALESSGYSTGLLPLPLPVTEGEMVWDDLLVPGSMRGIAFEAIAEVGEWVSKEIGRSNASRAGVAVLARKERRRVLAAKAKL